MKLVYDAAHAADAHLVKQLLEQAGIHAYLRGEYLTGALGELPVNGMIGVQVADADADHARQIVVEWQQGMTVAADEDIADADRMPSPIYARASAYRAPWRTAIVFGIGVAIGATLAWASLRGPSTPQTAIDHNGDGLTDERSYVTGTVPDRVEIDRNRDGAMDSIAYYDRNGNPDRVEDDDDFDGRIETTHHYRQALWTGTTVDHDGDGSAEYRMQTAAGVLYLEEWLTPDGAVIKNVVYAKGKPSRSDIDSDGDGTLDTRRHYDARAEIVRSEPLKSTR